VFGVGDFVQSANYDLDTISAGAYPEFAVGNFARTPSTFLLASPNLNTLSYLRQQDLTFQWTQATADEMLLVLTRMQDVGGTTTPRRPSPAAFPTPATEVRLPCPRACGPAGEATTWK